jgi:predicted transcriptional regulator
VSKAEEERRCNLKFNRWPKRNPIKNYFPVPNEIYCLGLEASEIAIYGYLLSIEDRKTYQCYPGYKTIGRAVKMSPNTVRKYVATLEEKGLISTEATMIRRKDGRPMNGSLLYTIRPIQSAVELYYTRQLRKMEEDADKHRMAGKLAKLAHRSPCEPLCAPLDEKSSPCLTQGGNGRC